VCPATSWGVQKASCRFEHGGSGSYSIASWTSTRTLSRRFKRQTGMTPLSWVLRARVRRAQALLETTAATIEEVATQVGYESAATLRGHLHRPVGVNLTACRRAMGGRSADSAG
jgi:transcriptional regulator GlxA family with amidase domain